MNWLKKESLSDYDPSLVNPWVTLDDFFEACNLSLSLAARLQSTLSDNFDSDDCKQHALLETLKCVEKYDPGKGSKFSTFVWHRVRRALGRWASKEKRVLDMSLVDESLPENKSRASSSEEKLYVEDLLKLLCDEDRKAIQYRFLEQGASGTTYGRFSSSMSEVARKLGCTRPGAVWRVNRATRKLKEAEREIC